MQNFSCSALLRIPPTCLRGFRLQACHLLRECFPTLSPNRQMSRYWRSYNPDDCIATMSVWAVARSLATTCAITFVFSSSGSCDVSVPRVWLILRMILRVCLSGLPHSEIHASQDICSLAWLIAACHVLRRLREPRHPSCALLSFPFSFLGKSPLIILVFFAVSANIPSACEVLICLVDVLFFF